MSDRRFDPEAAEEFIAFLRDEIDTINTRILDAYFASGKPLSKLPAFGIGGDSTNLTGKYTQFHGGVWSDLKSLVASYEGFIEALEQTIETNAESEAVTTAELDGLMEQGSTWTTCTSNPRNSMRPEASRILRS
jgi:hypothetical protein